MTTRKTIFALVKDRVFFSTCINLLGMPEEHIIQTYRLASHVICNMLQQIKDDLGPSTRSHTTPALLKLHATLPFLTGSFQHTGASLFLYL